MNDLPNKTKELNRNVTGGELILPKWAERLRDGYLSGEASQFLLHTNVGDLVRWESDGQTEYITLMEFLTRFLSRTKEVVLFYNISEGLQFAKREMRDLFTYKVTIQRRAKGDAEFSGVIPSNPAKVLSLVGEFISFHANRGAAIIDYLETLVPEGDMGYLSSDDRACLVAVQEWSRDPHLITSDNIVILVADNVTEVNRKVRGTPQLMSIEVGLPRYKERLEFIKYIWNRYSLSGISPEFLANMTAGLSCIQIETIFKNAAESGQELSASLVVTKKKEVIERECLGLVEVIEPDHGFDSVGGMDGIKGLLKGVSNAIEAGETRRVPMGVLLVGPMGTGKTYLAEAFARESGLTCIKLKSFREKWVGSTEANLERILSIIQALGHVLVIVDEADRNLGAEGRNSDSGTESRVIARLKEFMSNTAHRGRILFMILTNRPDKMDTDLKRPGRLDLKIPIFYPETAEERAEILKAVAAKNRYDIKAVDMMSVAKHTDEYSAADLEGLLITADRIASENESEKIKADHVAAAIKDFIPSRDSRYIEYMEILAAFEASSRRLLPEKYKNMTNDEMQQRLSDLRLALDI